MAAGFGLPDHVPVFQTDAHGFDLTPDLRAEAAFVAAVAAVDEDQIQQLVRTRPGRVLPQCAQDGRQR